MAIANSTTGPNARSSLINNQSSNSKTVQYHCKTRPTTKLMAAPAMLAELTPSALLDLTLVGSALRTMDVRFQTLINKCRAE